MDFVKQPIPFILLSNTARAGLTGFMKTVAREIAATGVTVNAVLPGTHATDRVQQTARSRAQAEGLSFEAAMEAQKANNPMRPSATPGTSGRSSRSSARGRRASSRGGTPR